MDNISVAIFIITASIFVSSCSGEKQNQQNVAPFKLRGSWALETSTTSFMSSDIMAAMCKNTQGSDDRKSDETDKETGTEDTEDETKHEVSTMESTNTDSFSMMPDKNKGCYACFSRISTSSYQIPTNMKDELEKCSQMYLAEGQFRNCVEELTKPHSSDDTSDVTSMRRTPQRKARDFSECVYTQLKRDMIQACIDEVSVVSPQPEDKMQQFLNTTTCVLSKFRCANFSISTGASRMLGQHQTVAALAVASTGDLHMFKVSDIIYGPGLAQTRFSSAEWQGNNC